jgi:hypothetical protein
MIPEHVDNRTSGIALVLGYSLYALVLFEDPASGLETATETGQGTVFFVLFPLGGLASGVNAYLAGPFHSGLAVLTATYLGAVGITLTLLLTGVSIVVTIVGLNLFVLAVIALVGSLRTALTALGFTEARFGLD